MQIPAQAAIQRAQPVEKLSLSRVLDDVDTLLAASADLTA
ncbi:MAG: hypothetical protein RL564_1885 [Pseudomonadota bacterium]